MWRRRSSTEAWTENSSRKWFTNAGHTARHNSFEGPLRIITQSLGGFEVLPRALWQSHLPEQDPPVVVDLPVPWRQCQRALIVAACLFKSLQLAKCVRAVYKGRDIASIQLKDLAEVIIRLGVVTSEEGDHADTHERIGVIGIPADRFMVVVFCKGELFLVAKGVAAVRIGQIIFRI